MTKYLLIVGSSPTALDDFIKMVNLLSSLSITDYHIMLIGLSSSAIIASDIDYIATYHPKDIKLIYEARRKIGANLNYKIISHTNDVGVNIVEPHIKPSGSSALLGTSAGIRLGYTKIILCGCPLEGKNDKASQPYDSFQRGWLARQNEIFPFVRSMSGWTKRFLGEPTQDWINE